ncbi:alpha/beta hydrolase [Brachyspira murdochii]|uniref:Putative esterase n=1 Tax=Brachyspira murdochii (strain ATCC 51284 / DSM 12563 / 56-150) TaxID=526224 RepID=D5U4C2_BRAM5|nr:alpha/beta hydrolase [Brachyspira murdochii]ADG70167.1 putative esterase [Brachyspira murdochii DSM 12563]
MKNIFILMIIVFSIISCNNANSNKENDMNNFTMYTNEDKSITVEQKNITYNIDYKPNVVYASKDNTDLTLQILVPRLLETDTNARYPLIVYIQGSAWRKQNVYRNLIALGDFARRGYVISIVEYRPSDDAVFPAQIEDTRDAISFMINNADKYNADTNNIFVWGDSSGGHTALFSSIPLSENDNTIPNINAIIAYYPPTDLLDMRNDPLGSTTGDADSPEGILIGRKNVYDFPEEAKRISPYYEISKVTNMPPIFLAHGMSDSLVPFNQSKILADKLKEENRVYEFYALKDADHGDWQFWAKDMFDLVEKFINKYKK